MNRIPEIKDIFMQDIICSLVNTRIKDAQVQKSFMNDNILTEIRLAELNLRKKYYNRISRQSIFFIEKDS